MTEDFEELGAWAAANGLAEVPPERLIEEKAVDKLFDAEIKRTLEPFAIYERPEYVGDPWRDMLKRFAEAHNIPFQLEVLPRGGVVQVHGVVVARRGCELPKRFPRDRGHFPGGQPVTDRGRAHTAPFSSMTSTWRRSTTCSPLRCTALSCTMNSNRPPIRR